MPNKIHLHNHDVKHRFKNIKLLKSVLQQIFVDEEFLLGELTFILCSDNYLLEMNGKYLGHDTYTDILTFDLSQQGGPIVGEIYISLERVVENASKFMNPLNDELFRVMIHGILHLCRYNDHSEEEILLMRTKENFYLAELEKSI